MSDDRIGEKLAMALGDALIRAGALSLDDIAAAANRESDPAVAHLLNCMALQAAAPPQSDWEAERRRAQMRVVPTDGGNSD